MLAFEYPIRPFTFGPRSSPFFAMPYLAVGGVGPWAWAGVAGRWARRHAAPRRRRPFHFFRDLAFLKSPQKKLAIKFWRFSVRRRGSGVSPVSSSSVLSGKTRVCAKNQAESRKKSETADGGGGCVSPRPTARSYPSPTAGSLAVWERAPFCWGRKSELAGHHQHHGGSFAQK